MPTYPNKYQAFNNYMSPVKQTVEWSFVDRRKSKLHTDDNLCRSDTTLDVSFHCLLLWRKVLAESMKAPSRKKSTFKMVFYDFFRLVCGPKAGVIEQRSKPFPPKNANAQYQRPFRHPLRTFLMKMIR